MLTCGVTLADTRRREHYAATHPASRERYAELYACGQRSGDARHDLEIDTGRAQRIDLLLRTPEDHRITAFEPHYGLMPHSSFAQRAIDEALIGGDLAAAFPDRDDTRARR